MQCNVVGGGISKTFVEPDKFTIGTNFHCMWANLIFAVDEPMLRELLSKTNKLIFTTPKVAPKYRRTGRVFEFDSKRHYNTNSLSSGLNAVCLANQMGFDTLYSFGFENRLEQLEQIQDIEKKYIFR